jgi:hypothetical protein
MKINLLSLIFSLLSILAYGQQGQARREIPTSWIEKLQKYDYKTSANDLVREFQTYIAPDSLAKFDKEASLNSMFVNLDEDAEVEVLVLFNANFAVLKKLDSKWFMIYKENEHLHSLKIIHVSNNKAQLICLEGKEAEGDIIAPTFYRFYRIVNEQVYICLELPKKQVFGQDSFRIVYANFELTDTAIQAKYEFYAFNKLKNSEKENSLIFQTNIVILYDWIEQEKKYSTQNTSIASALQWLKKDDLQTIFFQKELERIKTSGTKEQKKALKQYLKDHKKH